MSKTYPFPLDPLEQLEQDEVLIAREIIREMARWGAQRQGSGCPRMAHAKSHGCVRARFEVHGGVPGDLAHGLFAQPAEYDAWVRFSSGSHLLRSDMQRDVRGMAIKVVGVSGERLRSDPGRVGEQDFVMASAPNVPFSGPAEYQDFVQHMLRGEEGRYMLHPSRVRYLPALARALKVYSSPLSARYFSAAPYRFGPQVVKFGVSPLSQEPDRVRGEHGLREAMKSQLEEGPARFSFQLQRRTHPEEQPIEDGSVIWSEADSPFMDVATLTIPQQTFDTQARDRFAEGLRFDPWNGLATHRPLGGLNRLRSLIYERLSSKRVGVLETLV